MTTKTKPNAPASAPDEPKTAAQVAERIKTFRKESADNGEKAAQLTMQIARLKARGEAVPDQLYADLQKAERDRDGSGLVVQLLEEQRAYFGALEASDDYDRALASIPDLLIALREANKRRLDGNAMYVASIQAFYRAVRQVDDLERRLTRDHKIGDAKERRKVIDEFLKEAGAIASQAKTERLVWETL